MDHSSPINNGDSDGRRGEDGKIIRRRAEKPITKEDLGDFKQPYEYGQDVPLPHPFATEDQNRNYVRDRFYRKPPADGVIPASNHMKVTEFSLDHWLAQTFKLNIDQIPPVRPSHIPKTVYEQLRKYVKSIVHDNQAKKAGKKQSKRASGLDNPSSENLKLSQIGESKGKDQLKQTKYTYIVYPKTSKLPAYVDLLEQQLNQDKPEKKEHLTQSDSINEDNKQESNDVQQKDETAVSPTKSASSLPRKAKRDLNGSASRPKSRSQSMGGRNGSQGGGSASVTKSQKLGNYQKYQRPNRAIRNRINSDVLNFLNPQEIEKTAHQYESYLHQVSKMQSNLQTGAFSLSKNEIMPLQRQQIDASQGREEPKRLIKSERRSSLATNQMIKSKITIFQQNHSHFDKRRLRGSMQVKAQSMTLKSSQKQNIAISPYQNLPETFSSHMMLSQTEHGQPKLIQSPTTAETYTLASPRAYLASNPSIITKLQGHLDKAKTITTKSKITLFRERMESEKEMQRGDKLKEIVKRNHRNINLGSTGSYQNQLHQKTQESLKPVLISPLRLDRINQNSAATLQEVRAQPFASTRPSTIIFQRVPIAFTKKQHQFNDSTISSEVIIHHLDGDMVSKTQEETQSHLNATTSHSLKHAHKVNALITKHLDEEIEEERDVPRDNISINMIDITMDFNELQKRFNDMNNPDFWLQKAIQKQRNQAQNGVEGAIDYYKQGLRINPGSEKLLYNMACCYEKIGKFENSIRWFKHVLEINPNNSDAYYGLALANFKVKRYFEAHKCVEKAIEFYQETALLPIDNMKYFRAMCYKKTGDQEACSRDYQALKNTFTKNMNKDMVKYVYGVLLLPLQDDRKLINNFIENLNELMIFFQKKAPSVKDKKAFISQFCITQKVAPPWKFDFQKYQHFIYYYLQQKSFFKRLGKLFHFQKEIESALVVQYQQDDLVLVPHNDLVGVVLVGTLFALSHADGNVLKPRLLSKLIEGSVIFHPDVDNGQTSHPETWIQAYETTEIIYMTRANFFKLWEEQKMQTSKQIVMASLQKNMFFHFINPQLKYHLIYETLVERVYSPGEIIVLQSKRSSMNDVYKFFFENRPTKLRQEIENKKMTNEMNTGKKHSEIGSLMDVMRDNIHIRKLAITSPQGVQQDKVYSESSQGPLSTLRQHQRVNQFNGDDDQEDYKSKIVVPMETQGTENVVIQPQVMPQCLEEDEEDRNAPYCRGVYVVSSGSVNIRFRGETCFTLTNGDSFGESVIIKQPSYEYFGDLVAGQNGAKIYLFNYDMLRLIPFQSIIDILEIAGFQRKKDGLVHIMTQKYGFDSFELMRY